MSTLSNIFTSIADAIREKTGKSDTMTPDEMAAEIENIDTSGGMPNMKIYEFTPPEGFTTQTFNFEENVKFIILSVNTNINIGGPTDVGIVGDGSGLFAVFFDIENNKNCCTGNRISGPASNYNTYAKSGTFTFNPEAKAQVWVNGLSINCAASYTQTLLSTVNVNIKTTFSVTANSISYTMTSTGANTNTPGVIRLHCIVFY